jgi:tetratricopeptide (TPR) repeat protein
VPKDYLTQNLIGQFHYMLANTLERSDWPRARREYAEAMKAAPHNDVLFFNLGLIFGGHGLYDEAIAAFRRVDRDQPAAGAGPRSPEGLRPRRPFGERKAEDRGRRGRPRRG